MSANISHECFPQPEDNKVKIWRYISFAKYVFLLSQKSLFFCRADLFNDPFEGSYSKANVKLRPIVYEGKIPETALKQMADFSMWSKEWTHITSWHYNNYESAAMWKLYAGRNELVAIQSSYERLVNCLPNNVFVGLVKYIDYERDWLPEGNTFFPFMHKRRSFEYEQEVRAIVRDLPSKNGKIPVGMPNKNKGINIDVNLDNLIENIYIAPTSPKWYLDLVRDVTMKYDLDKQVISSDLDKEPVY